MLFALLSTDHIGHWHVKDFTAPDVNLLIDCQCFMYFHKFHFLKMLKG